MKQLIQILALSTLTFGLTACDPFEGLLQVKKAFTVISTEKTGSCGGEAGDFNCEQKVNVQIPVGDQNAKLDFLGRDQVQITLKVDGRKKQITMDLPKNANIPQNDEFMITAADLQQGFSIKGGSATNTSDSQTYREFEQCTYTRYETVCNIVNNQQICHQVPRTVYGQQRVEYFIRSTNQNINVNFIEKAAVASFNGSRSSSQKIYTRKDYCF